VVEQSFNEPISIAGVRVEPGDYVVADMSGVVFIPRRLVEDIAAGAEIVMRRDNGLAERIRAGVPVSQVMGAKYERLAGDDPARG
jgi:regulator of RNase E activity RraA